MKYIKTNNTVRQLNESIDNQFSDVEIENANRWLYREFFSIFQNNKNCAILIDEVDHDYDPSGGYIETEIHTYFKLDKDKVPPEFIKYFESLGYIPYYDDDFIDLIGGADINESTYILIKTTEGVKLISKYPNDPRGSVKVNRLDSIDIISDADVTYTIGEGSRKSFKELDDFYLYVIHADSNEIATILKSYSKNDTSEVTSSFKYQREISENIITLADPMLYITKEYIQKWKLTRHYFDPIIKYCETNIPKFKKLMQTYHSGDPASFKDKFHTLRNNLNRIIPPLLSAAPVFELNIGTGTAFQSVSIPTSLSKVSHANQQVNTIKIILNAIDNLDVENNDIFIGSIIKDLEKCELYKNVTDSRPQVIYNYLSNLSNIKFKAETLLSR